MNYLVFHGYLFIHCLGSHHVLCLSGIVCAHILCSIWIFVGYLSFIFSIFLNGYKETCSYFTNKNFFVTIGD